MKFNIKEWQQKYLIKESKGLKKEIDFKNQDAFKKYNAKHKMRKSTKFTIGGRETTAGEESDKEKKPVSTASKMTPQQKEDTVYGAFEMLGDTLARDPFQIDGYNKKMMQGDLESIKKSGMSIDDAKAELENLMGRTEQEDEYGNPSWPEESKEAMYSHLEDIYAQEGSGEESGKEKKAASSTSTKGREIGSEEFGEILNGMDQEAQTYYDDGAQEDLLNKMNDAFEDANLFDGDGPITYDKVAAALDDTGLVDDEDREHLKRQMRGKFDVEDEGGDDDDYASGFGDTDVPSDEFEDTLDYDDEAGHYGGKTDPSDKFLNAEDALENGLMDQEEFDRTVRWLHDEGTDALVHTVSSNFYGSFSKEEGRERRGKDIAAEIDKYEDAIAHDPEAFVRNLESSIIQKGKDSVRDWNNIKNGNWRTTQAINDKLSDIAPEAPSISWDNIARELEYDIDDEGNIKDESVRIQESRIYKTIQELKALERGI
jgi:hypothetical protein